MRDGNLTVVDAIFTDNHAAPLGPDTAVARSTCSAARTASDRRQHVRQQQRQQRRRDRRAVHRAHIYNSLFIGNVASGNGANYADPDMCYAINNGQNEVGSGGNGGAIYSDGNDINLTLCGTAVLDNKAGAEAFGGGIFFTSNNFGGVLTIKDSTITGKPGGSLDPGAVGQREERRVSGRHPTARAYDHELDRAGRCSDLSRSERLRSASASSPR